MVPATKDLTRPILQWARGQSEEFTRREAGDVMANYFNLSAEAKAELTIGGKIRYQSNANWAVSHLKYAGLLHQTDKGNYQITNVGREEAFSSNEVMTEKYLRDKFPCYQIAREQASKNRNQSGVTIEKEKQPGNNQSLNVSGVQENRNEQSEQVEVNQNIPISTQIAQLWQLKQEGALTQEEFDEQKTKLLLSAQIAQLWRLKQEGALTQEEFDEQKAKLLQS